jgi:copper chaperone CopZ
MNQEQNELSCCVVSCETPLDQHYWDQQYQANATGWDLGQVSPPIKSYIDQLKDKSIRILIPGAGNAYEAEYLLQQGFTSITVIDIAPTVVQKLQHHFSGQAHIHLIQGDFFDHEEKYDLIIEQTFFCALPPSMRQRYVWKMHSLLNDGGRIAGVMFNRSFESGPPFGGSQTEYEQLFQTAFEFKTLACCINSVKPRHESELFVNLMKNSSVHVGLYQLSGFTCMDCVETASKLIEAIQGVKHVSINTAMNEMLIVSEKELLIEAIKNVLSYDSKYSIDNLYTTNKA